MNEKVKQLIIYTIVAVILLILSLINNIFWKIGKSEQLQNNIVNLESDNIIYNVPFEEKWLD